jgi:hypothetical protein
MLDDRCWEGGDIGSGGLLDERLVLQEKTYITTIIIEAASRGHGDTG